MQKHFTLCYLGPWLHENWVVPSTLHQCFNFYKERVKKIEVNVKSFIEVESCFVDANFSIEDDAI